MSQIIRLDTDAKLDLVRMVEDDLGEDTAARQKFDNRRRHFYHAYRNRVRAKTDPWQGCSNFNLPLITRAIDRTAIHVNGALFPRGLIFPIEAVPVGVSPLEDEAERARRTSELLRFTFRNRMKISDPIERFNRGMLTNGNGFGKLWWARVERNVRIVERMQAFEFVPEDEDDPDSPMQEIEIPVGDSVSTYFSNYDVERMVQTAEGKWRIDVFDAEEKRLKQHEVEGFFDEESRDNVLLIKFRRLVKNQPAFDNVSMDDIHFSQDAMNIQDVRRVHLRHFLTLSDLEQGYRRGKWTHLTAEDMDELRERVKEDHGTEREELQEGGLTPIDRKVASAADEAEGVSTRLKKPFEVWESFYSHDIDGDGELEEVTIWTDPETRKVLRVAYTSEEYYTDERPIIHASLIPIENRLLGIGIAEALMPLTLVMNHSINSRADAADMMLRPPTFFRPGSGYFPSSMRLRPGAAFQLDNPQVDVNQMEYRANPFGAAQIEQFLMAFVEDLSVSASSTGQTPPRQQTARGTLALLQQDQIKMDYVLGRLMPAIETLSHMTLNLLRLNGTDKETFRVVGSKKLEEVSREDLGQRLDFYFDLDSISGNREIQRLYAAQALEGTLELAMMPPEAVTQGARILGRNFLKALEIRNAADVLPDPMGFDRPPQDQEEETQAMLRGNPIQPIMADDHMDHILKMDASEREPWFETMAAEWVLSVWKPHKIAHVRFMRILQAQQQAVARDVGGAQTGAFGLRPETVPGSAGGGGGLPGLGNLVELAAEARGSTLTGGNDTQI